MRNSNSILLKDDVVESSHTDVWVFSPPPVHVDDIKEMKMADRSPGIGLALTPCPISQRISTVV